ncbi:histone deacetylase complex subunit SAP25 [Zootoca vivipara]|uniref:histone deacetylase complex subunit SAP25 n=1 Tax=Zootoca vivipara TaxID=8524 RepID=UPI00293B9D01|nr:histone deacetylase complex subunit SAP25 [Zootoca vivipara]
MFDGSDPRHELWDTEEEEEDDEGSRDPTAAADAFSPRTPCKSGVRQDTKAICVRNWPTQQATRCCSRTLSHPSFQSFYTAVSTCSRSSPAAAADQGASPSELEPKATPLPPVDCSGFYYTDPTMPPGHRIYNCLSVSTQEVLRSLTLETPAPIMSVCRASPPRRASPRTQWLSELECKAVSALMELPDSAGQDPGKCRPSPCLPGEAEGLREIETSGMLP